jgi:hypothetical protein
MRKSLFTEYAPTKLHLAHQIPRQQIYLRHAASYCVRSSPRPELLHPGCFPLLWQ